MTCLSVLDVSENGDGQRGDPYSTGINKSTSYVSSTKDYDVCKEISHGEQEQMFQVSDKDHDEGKKAGRLHTNDQKLLATLDQILKSRYDAELYSRAHNLIWVESLPPFRKGFYTGVIDRKGRPHGCGTWVSENDLLTGWWYKGV